ncbi:helix-turn-helix transcriptional regulator [Actinocorallia lasiicapitis]
MEVGMATVRETLDPSTDMWHLIACELRRHRERGELSGARLAELLDCDRSTVSRYESGLLRLTEKHAAIVDRLWNTDGLFGALVGFARQKSSDDWFVDLRDYEARASRIKMWELTVVPGLLQTPAYTRALLTAGVSLIDDLESAIERRLERQRAVFDKKNPPLVSAILNWVVLEQPVADNSTMLEQLEYLAELAARTNVSIRVLEKGAGVHMGLDGPCKLLTVEDRDIGFVDAPIAGRVLTQPADVQSVAIRFDQIGDLAAPLVSSSLLIKKAMEVYR